MRKLVKIVGSTIIGLVAVLLPMSFTGFEPKDCPPTDKSVSCEVPGLWLKGGTRHYPSHRLVVHGQDSTDQDSDPDLVSAASFGDDLVRRI